MNPQPRPVQVWPEKDPADTLDYTLDFTGIFDDDPFLPSGDQISDVLFTTSSPDVTIHQQYSSGNRAVVWLSGGQSGVDYIVSCEARTLQGREARLAGILPVRTLKKL